MSGIQGMTPENFQTVLQDISSGQASPQQLAALTYAGKAPGTQAPEVERSWYQGGRTNVEKEKTQIADALYAGAQVNPELLNDPGFVAQARQMGPGPLADLVAAHVGREKALQETLESMGLPGSPAAPAAEPAAEPAAPAAPVVPAAPEGTPEETAQARAEVEQQQIERARARRRELGGIEEETPESVTEDITRTQPVSEREFANVIREAIRDAARARKQSEPRAAGGPKTITGTPVTELATTFRPGGYMGTPDIYAGRRRPPRETVRWPGGREGTSGLLEPLISLMGGPRGEFEKQAQDLAMRAFHTMLVDLSDWAGQASEMDQLAKQAALSVDGDAQVKTAVVAVAQADHIGRLMAHGQFVRLLGTH